MPEPAELALTLLLLSLLIGLLLFECWFTYLAYASTEWDAAIATIVEAKIDSYRTRHGVKRYRPKIRYRYNVDSQSYSSNRIAFHSLSFGFFDINTAMEDYVVGDEVIIYHAPNNPGRAVMQRGISGENIFSPILLSAFILAAGWIYLH